jgi:hypothetical protein
MWHYFNTLKPVIEEEKINVNFERYFLTMMTGEFMVKYWEEKDKDFARNYLDKRISDTKNAHLLMRYGLHLFYLTDNRGILHKALDDGLVVLKNLINDGSDNAASIFCDWFEKLYLLSKRTNQNGSYVKVLAEAVHSDRVDVQASTLSMIYFSDYSYESKVKTKSKVKTDIPIATSLHLGKLFRYADLAGIAMTLVESKKLKCEDQMLTVAAYYAEKCQDKTIIIKSNEALGDYWLSELKPDDPNNLAVAHLNDCSLRNAMEYFKKAHNNEKLRQVTKLYEENKPKLRFIPFQYNISGEKFQKRVDVINKCATYIVKKGTNAIIGTLFGYGLPLFGLDAEKIEKKAKEDMQRFHFETMMGASTIDSFGNIKMSTHEQIEIFSMIDNAYRNFTYYIFSLVIMNGLKHGTLSYDILSDYLLKLGFDMRIEKQVGDNHVGSTYLERVDVGLKDFLKQSEAMMNNETTDWRFCISFLSTQFEGLLRDIVQRLGGPVTKIKHGTDTELILLEGLLDSECLQQVFDANDLLLFRETFTNTGYNIRNNVAHGMYLPDEFTSTKALLVFVSALRLAKATLVIVKNI